MDTNMSKNQDLRPVRLVIAAQKQDLLDPYEASAMVQAFNEIEEEHLRRIAPNSYTVVLFDIVIRLLSEHASDSDVV